MTRGGKHASKRAYKKHLEACEELKREDRKARALEIKSKQIGGNAKTRWGREHQWRSSGVHCCGVTKTGSRCTSVTLFPNCFCARHQKQTSVERHVWCVEGRPQYTNVSRPLPRTPPRGHAAQVAEVVEEEDPLDVVARRELKLPLPIRVSEERVGALELGDLQFLS